MSDSDFKLGRFLQSVPVLNLPAKAMRSLSGVAHLADLVQSCPQNPFLHYRLALRYDRLDGIRNMWRWTRAALTLGHSEAFRFAIRGAIRLVDGQQEAPQVLICLNAVALAHKQLRFDPANDSLLLLLGAASLQLYKRSKDRIWLARAIRAFILVLRSSKNIYRVADAAAGLQDAYNDIGEDGISQGYASLVLRLKHRMRRTYKNGAMPSIWDLA